MLNSRSSSVINQNIKFNAVSGTMFKSCPNSFFKRFNLKSEYSEIMFSRRTYIVIVGNYSNNYREKELPVIVLQTMLVGDMEVLAEIITEEDYNSLNWKESE